MNAISCVPKSQLIPPPALRRLSIQALHPHRQLVFRLVLFTRRYLIVKDLHKNADQAPSRLYTEN
jgi:hypothetical protein